MLTKVLNADFFVPAIYSLAPQRLEDAIGRIVAMAEGEERTMQSNDMPVYLERHEQHGELHVGMMTRLRTGDPAIKGSVGRALERIPLDPDESLASCTAFAYHPTHNILVLERNRLGVGAAVLGAYFATKGEINGLLALDLIVDPRAITRAEGFDTIRSLEISLARPGLIADLGLRDETWAGANAIAQQLDAPKISVKLSMGHGTGSLSVRQTRGLINQFKRLCERFQEAGDVQESPVETFKVYGKRGDEPLDLIDVINGRIGYEETVDMTSDPETLWIQKMRFVRAAIHAKQDECAPFFQPIMRRPDA